MSEIGVEPDVVHLSSKRRTLFVASFTAGFGPNSDPETAPGPYGMSLFNESD